MSRIIYEVSDEVENVNLLEGMFRAERLLEFRTLNNSESPYIRDLKALSLIRS